MGKTCTVKENKVILQQQIPPRFPFEQRTRAELRFYRDMDYTKKALDYTQILTQLKARGLLFKDEERAVEVLANISYSTEVLFGNQLVNPFEWGKNH